MDRTELEHLDREGLVMRAQAAGIRRARVLTRPELIDELLRLDATADQTQLKKTRGFFGIARDLLSKVVECGLHLPDAADRLRAAFGNPLPQVPRPEPQAVPTVTLAEIYAAQGHKQRAIDTVKRVLEAEPEHAVARALVEKLEAADYVAPPPPLPPEPDEVRDEIGFHLGVPSPEEGPARGPSASAPVTPRVEAPTTLPRPPVPTECVAIPIPSRGLYVWWRLSQDARRAAEESSFVVRVLILVPTWDGPHRTTRDVACDPTGGELVVGDLPDGAVVRVAVGVLDASTFVPLAHSPAIETSPSRALVQWTPDGATPIALEDPRAASIARAAEGAARATGHRSDAG